LVTISTLLKGQIVKALLLVDIQNDFLPDGALAVPAGDQVVPVANRLMSQYDLVIATQDWHPANHQSFASQHVGKSAGDIIKLDGRDQILWPDHCVQGTKGARFAAGLNTDGIHYVIQKGTDASIDSYSGFFDNARRRSTGLNDCLRNCAVGELHVMGLATDYCVKFTALDAVDLGFRTLLLTDGIRGVELNEGDCARAVQEMMDAGVLVAGEVD
jgi:nicotinamidase/pyrazinamidase